jgi:hypothetical protein
MRHLHSITGDHQNDHRPATVRDHCTEEEVAQATARLLEHMHPVCAAAGIPMADLIASEAFGPHVIAYVIALRCADVAPHTEQDIHARAAGALLRMLHRTEPGREAAATALAALYRALPPAVDERALRVVRD